jgi:uncharacterized membrane protein YeaQ/YmgE (transglycosylase-associated protein family)
MSVLGVIWMIIVGFIVGALARWIYPGPIPMGFWTTAFIGVIGSLVGGVVAQLLWRSRDGRFQPAGLILSVIGALGVLWVYLKYFAK